MTGAELRTLRLAARTKKGEPLTQTQAGIRLGLTKNSVARMERNEMGITPTVERLARLVLSPTFPRKYLDPEDP